MDRFTRQMERASERKRRMADPEVADNMEVRRGLVEAVESGEMTLAEAQKRLRAIQRKARRGGAKTLYGR